MRYTEKLRNSIQKSGSALCVGLDPNLDLIPGPIQQQFENPVDQVTNFCKQVIDATQSYCAAYKPNVAFFEALGSQAYVVLNEVLNHIPDDKIVIIDAKRGDIHSTAEHYKKAFFDQFDADAITINPLMGFETLSPFLKDPSRAAYVLTLTSNDGADDFLKRPFTKYEMMSQYIANRLNRLTTQNSTHLGMVIGATQPKDITDVVRYHPQGALLIPGIGAQGGSVSKVADALQDHKGIPLISSSRSIIYAGGNTENWTDKVARKAKQMKSDLEPLTERYV